MKATQCRYRDNFGLVTIYYDQLTDLFAVVDSTSNRLLEFAIETEIDYADIFGYKSVFQSRVASDTSECLAPNSNSFDNICSLEEENSKPKMSVSIDEELITRQFENFDTQKNQGLPTT